MLTSNPLLESPFRKSIISSGIKTRLPFMLKKYSEKDNIYASRRPCYTAPKFILSDNRHASLDIVKLPDRAQGAIPET
uniref:Uncharacterized protein n=1 Tax=Romanomermis culicivorax TaxID=13658 RepID=A0A915JU55_ROMCU